MDDNGGVLEVAERARVVDVEVGLDDVRYRPGLHAEPLELRGAVLVLAHVHFEDVRQPTPVCAGIAGDGQRVTAVDDHVPLRMAEEEERDGHLRAI